MKRIFRLFFPSFVALLALALPGHAQEALVACGGEGSSGSSGAVSQSVGQVFYIVAQNANFQLWQGVQQPLLRPQDGPDNPDNPDKPSPDNPSAVTAEQLPGVHAFPNPMGALLRVQLPAWQPDSRYWLLDAQGRCVRQGLFPQLEALLDVQDLGPGLYLLRVRQGHREAKIRLIKR